MLKLNLTTSEKIETLLTELISGLAWAAVMLAGMLILVALWIIYRPDIQEALRTAQNVMFG